MTTKIKIIGILGLKKVSAKWNIHVKIERICAPYALYLFGMVDYFLIAYSRFSHFI